MRNFTIAHREVGDKSHILNFSLGEIMSFERADGRYLLDNLNDLNSSASADTTVDPSVVQFLTGATSHFSSRTFRSSLVTLGMRFGFPSIANLELNRRCVLRCQHCYIPTVELASKAGSAFEQEQPDVMPGILESLHRLGVFLVVLTGGEVFLNRRLKSILQECARHDFIVETFSSLQFIPDWLLASSPFETRIGRVQTSVYSVTPPIHDTVTGVPGSMDRTLRNLATLADRGYYVEVATPLMATNFDSRHEIEQHFGQLGIKHSFAWPIVSEYYGGSEKKALLNITKEQFLQFCLERPDYLIQLNPSNGGEPICAAGKAVIAISANGDIFSCSQFPRPVGNILAADGDAAYRSAEMIQIGTLTKADIPADAVPYNYCIGNNYSETGDPLRQSDYVRESLAFYEKYAKTVGAA